MPRIAALVTVSCLLAACSGGGGSGSSQSPSVSPQSPAQLVHQKSSQPAVDYSHPSILSYANFEQLAANVTTSEICWHLVRDDLCTFWDNTPPRVVRRADFGNGNSLEVHVSANKQDVLYLKDVLEADYAELFVTFRIMYAAGFDWGYGAKMFVGIVGQAPGKAYPTGGSAVRKDEGFSVRTMWKQRSAQAPRAFHYIYHPDTPTYLLPYGDELDLFAGDQPFMFRTGVEYLIETRVKMNDPFVSNGVVETYVNGQRVAYGSHYNFSDSGGYGINVIDYSMFYGGNGSWAPSKASTLFVDDIVVSTRPLTNSFK